MPTAGTTSRALTSAPTTTPSNMKLFMTRLEAMLYITETLAKLTHLTMCVASGSSLSLVRAGLGMVGLDRFFGAHIYTVEMVARGKPAPDSFLHAATQIGAPPPDRG